MKKALTTLLAAATVAAALAGSATTASAQRGLVPGLLGGFVAGAIVGGALASRPPGYVVYPGYAAPVAAPNCYWTRQPVYDPYGRIVGWRGRPVEVCE